MNEHSYHACTKRQCDICDNGVLFCEVCTGEDSNSSLPTHCPGYRMTPVRYDSVTRGEIDFICGEWTYTS